MYRIRPYYVIFAVLLLLELCPIWFTPYPAMHDYPNHLARIHVLHEYSGNRTYQAIYETDLKFMPNLAMDLIVPALMDIMSVETASKVFLSLLVVVFNLGLHLMGVALNGRPHWNALAATFFTYNLSFAYGFVNYMFGVGMFFITLAAWLHYRSQWTLKRIVFISILALMCYLSHLSAVVFFGISVVCWTAFTVIQDKSLQRDHILGLMPLVVPALAYVVYSLGSQPKTPMQWWGPILETKIRGLLFPFVTYHLLFDLGLGLAFLSLVLLAVKIKEARLLCPQVFWIGGIFISLYAFAPSSAGGTHFVDRRFLLPACILLLLAFRIETRKTLGCCVLVGLIGISAVRSTEVWHYWHHIGQEVQEQVRMLDHVPDGARVYPMVERNPTRGWLRDMHFFFLAHYATIYRHAFVPTIYAWQGVHPLKIRVDGTEGSAQAEIPRSDQGIPSFNQVNWTHVLSHYDYLWAYKLSEASKRFLVFKGEIIAEANDAVLIRIRKA